MNRSYWYPLSSIARLRSLRFRKAERGLEIYPEGQQPIPPAEIVHDNSAVVPSLRSSRVQVIEWSDDGRLERHSVRLS